MVDVRQGSLFTSPGGYATKMENNLLLTRRKTETEAEQKMNR